MNELLAVYKRFLQEKHMNYRGNSPTRIYTEAELIWSGENYILVREGPYDGTRRAVLVDKGGLMLLRGNGGSHLEALAMSTLHPVQIQQVNDSRIILHTSGKGGDGERWCNALVEKLIAQAKVYDDSYEGEFERIKSEFEERNEISRQAVTTAKSLGMTVYGTLSRDGVEWPAGEQYALHPGQNSDRVGLFWVGRLDGKISVNVTTLLQNLTLDQFERLASLLKEIKETEHDEQRLKEAV